MLKKYIVLALMLIIPACLFLFLKFQGKNHFQLEVMVPVLSENCENVTAEVDSNYQLADFSFASNQDQSFSYNQFEGNISILHILENLDLKKGLAQMNELERVQSVIANKEEISLFTIYGNEQNEESQIYTQKLKSINRESSSPWGLYILTKPDVEQLSKCLVGVGQGEAKEANIVLVDKQKRIRGYYNGNEREEIDRLITELQVLEFEYK